MNRGISPLKIQRIKGVVRSILPEIRPKKVDTKKAYAMFEKAKGYLKTCAKRLNIPGKVVLTGSLAKGTFLKGNHDIDIFLLIPISYDIDRDFVNKLGDCLKNKMDRIELDYAQHPYISANIGSWVLDMVPAYDIEDMSHKKSAVDRTVFHTKYVLSHISDKQKDEIRLVKQFLKANNLYGAEMRTEGFPGYLCELMIIHYKSFIGFLEGILDWEIGKFIDIEEYYKESSNHSFDHPLVVVDPTDKNRNVASALSLENFLRLKVIVKQFLEKPSLRYFKIHKITKAGLVKNLRLKYPHKPVIKLSFRTLYESEEANWGKIKRILRQIKSKLKELGVGVVDYALFVDSNRYLLYLVPSKDRLPKMIEYGGPDKKFTREYARFKKIHISLGDKIIEKNDGLYAQRKRSETDRNLESAILRILNKLSISNLKKPKIIVL